MTFGELLTQAERNDVEQLWLVDKYSGIFTFIYYY